MNQSTAHLVGGSLIALGVGGGAYAYWRYRQRQQTNQHVSAPQVSVTPYPLPAGQSLATVTIAWQNGANVTANYAVQAAWLEEVSAPSGVIAGHLFNSQAAAQQSLSNPGLVTQAGARLAAATAPAGGTDRVTLYGNFNPSELVGPFALAIWIRQNPPASALLAQDPTGMQVTTTSAAGRFLSETLAVS